jgi:hypothetical protein
VCVTDYTTMGSVTPGNPNENMVSYAIRGSDAGSLFATVAVGDESLFVGVATAVFVELPVGGPVARLLLLATLLVGVVVVPVVALTFPRDRGRPTVDVTAGVAPVGNGSNAIRADNNSAGELTLAIESLFVTQRTYEVV